MASRTPIDIQPAQRYSVIDTEGVVVHETSSPTAKVTKRLPKGTIIVAAEVATDTCGVRRARISSPAGWIEAARLGEAPPATPLRYEKTEFEQHHLEIAPGNLYGLDFPFTLEMLERSGAEFLTRAFQAAGTLPDDNRVVSILRLEPCFLGQASDKAFLEVEYAKEEPGLATKLFVKVPASDPERKFYLATRVTSEVEFARLSADGAVPVDVPRFYFGDYSSRTSNFILITEQIAFGEGKIAAACDKARDHELPDARDRYIVLTRALANLAAAQKRGALGNSFEATFPYSKRASQSAVTVDPAEKLDKLIEFIAGVAPSLFPAWARSEDFLARFREDVLLGLANAGLLARQLHANVDYVGLCHPNLNLDNAWFWHDSDGALRAGLLDWGTTRQMNYGQALLGMLMFPEPEIYRELVGDVVKAFVSEFGATSGQALDAGTLHRHIKASLFVSTIPMLLSIVVDQFDSFPRDAYGSMSNRFDERLIETGLAGGVIWVRNVLEEWHDDTTPGDVCREILAADT